MYIQTLPLVSSFNIIHKPLSLLPFIIHELIPSEYTRSHVAFCLCGTLYGFLEQFQKAWFQITQDVLILGLC